MSVTKTLKKDFSTKNFDFMAQDSHPLMQRISTLEVGGKRTEPTNKEYTDSSQLKVR